MYSLNTVRGLSSQNDNIQSPHLYIYQEYCYKSAHRLFLTYKFLQETFPFYLPWLFHFKVTFPFPNLIMLSKCL